MKKYLLVLGIILLIAFALTSSDAAKPDSAKGKIIEFSATDMPFDDGAGIVLKWTPLHRSHRVIAYNIYRGVSPDSLFLLSSLEVDPKLGVLAPELFFYDRGDQPIIEFETSPVRLKKEKQQAPNSPLFRHFPQQAKLLSTLFGRYNIIGGIDSGKMYRSAVPITSEDEVMAGLKLHRFEYIFAFPMEGQEYFYTVLAVNERGRLLPHADIQKVIPQDNPPEPATVVSSTYIQDTGFINFEWNPPSSSPDIAMWEGWLARKTGSVNQETANPGSSTNGFQLPENWRQSAIQLFQLTNYFKIYPSQYQVDTKKEGISLPQNMSDYIPVLAYSDYAGMSAAVPARHYRVLDSSALPKIPDFEVRDKINDKGDNLTVSIGKPIAYVSSAIYLNKAKTALRINYELSENEHYKVNRLLFTIFDNAGKKIGEVKEHYLDKTIRFNLPKAYTGITDMKIRVALQTKGTNNYDNDYTEQHIVYDANNKLFQGEEIFYRGEPISSQFYEILAKNQLEPDFRFGNRTNGITRTYDHSIPYESIVYQSIGDYDAKSNRLLIDPQVSIAADNENGYNFAVPLFRDVFEKNLTKQKAHLDSLLTQKALYPENAVPDSLLAAITQAEGNYKFITQHPAYLQAQKTKGNRAWLTSLLKTRAQNKRSYTYKLLKTDGKAAMVISDIYKDDKGNSSFMPDSQWFDNTKWLTLIGTILLMILLLYAIYLSRHKEVYIRPIAGLQEIDNAVGRATEMGRPIMFVPGWGTLGDPCTIASLMILSQVAKKAAEFDTRLISPHCDYMVLPLAQELVQTSFSEVGRPDAYNQNDIFFISYDQFPFCAGVNGITVRERVATIFYMGYFNAEALLLTETGNQTGAIQIAATDAVTQIPFFITTCDYTLIGEEFYAASAYMSRNPELVSMLKASDYFKLVIVVVVIIGTVLSSLNLTGFINSLPIE